MSNVVKPYSCVLKCGTNVGLDNVTFPALKVDKLLSGSKSPTVISGSKAVENLMSTLVIPLSFQL